MLVAFLGVLVVVMLNSSNENGPIPFLLISHLADKVFNFTINLRPSP